MPGKRPYLLHRKRIRTEAIFHIPEAKIRAANRPLKSRERSQLRTWGWNRGVAQRCAGHCVCELPAPRRTKVRNSIENENPVRDWSIDPRVAATREWKTRENKRKEEEKTPMKNEKNTLLGSEEEIGAVAG